MFIELRHLRLLQAMAQNSTLAAAAEQLHLTPSALSHQIKSLEQHFDVALFLRHHKPLRLSPAGQRLLDLAQRVLPQVNAMEHELKRLAGGESGRLHITIECHACFEWLLPTLERYRQDWPGVDVDIRLGVSFDPLPALTRGEVDLVISSDPVELRGVVFQALFDYQALLAVAPDHPLAARAWVAPADLASETLITYPVETRRLDVFRRFLDPAGVRPAAWRQAELTPMILQLVAIRQGVAVLPDWVLQAQAPAHRLSTCRLGRQGMRGSLYAAVRESDSKAAYVQAFIDLARHLNGGK